MENPTVFIRIDISKVTPRATPVDSDNTVPDHDSNGLPEKSRVRAINLAPI